MLLLTGCAGGKTAPALSLDWAKMRQGIYAGSPLEGAQSVPAVTSDAGAVEVEIRFVAMAGDPGEVLEPLATKARVLTTTQGENPFLATATLTLPARYGMGAEAEQFEAAIKNGAWGQSAVAGDLAGALPAGATAWLQMERGTGTSRDRVRVAVYRPRGDAAEVQLALQVEHPEAVPTGEGTPAKAAAAKRLSRETALVRQPVGPAGDTLALATPLAVSEGNMKALGVLVRLSPLTGNSEAQIAKSVELMRAAAALAQRESVIAAPDSLDPAMVASVVEAITLGDQRRPALVYFASQTRAGLGELVAMVADEGTLDEISLQFADALGKQQGLWKRDEAGWLLDRLAFQRLAQGTMKGRLTPELRGVLAAYAGEAGRSPAALEEIQSQLTTRKDFDNRLLAENVIALEDNSPAARVRAFDWLKARGHAPEGYDPLGDPKARREAMERALQSMTSAQATPAAGNAGGKNEVKP